MYFTVSLLPFGASASRQPKYVSFCLLSCELLVFSLSRKVSFSIQVLLKSRSQDLRLVVKLLNLSSCHNYDYQIVILSRYIQLICKRAIDIFACYQKSCYHLRLLVQAPIVTAFVSFIMIALFCQICILMPHLRGRTLNYRFSFPTYLCDYYIYLHDCHIYLYLLVVLAIYWFSLFRQLLPIVNQIYGLDLSLNQFEATKWSLNISLHSTPVVV